MKKSDLSYKNYPQKLNEEFTDDRESSDLIAIAYAAAEAREVLEAMPERIIVEVSEEIIKNAKGNLVPNVNNLMGIEAAIAAGIVAGKAEKKSKVISDVTEEEKSKIKECIKNCQIEVKQAETAFIFDIQVNLFYKELSSKIRIVNDDFNIILIEKNGKILYIKEAGFSDDNLLKTGESINSEDFIDIKDIKDIIRMKN